MSNVAHYLRELVDSIGPRPVASDTERAAAEWISKTFRDMGLPSEIQDFEANRTTTWPNVLHFIIAILCVAGAVFFTKTAFLRWTFLVLLTVDIISFYYELNGGRILSRFLSKGPSQNVVARYSPRLRTSDTRRKKVVIVAHYDSLRCSPFTSDSMLAFAGILSTINRFIFILLPLLLFFMLMPFVGVVGPWLGWTALALCIIPFLLMVDLIIRGTVKRFSPGANNNASGVAALLQLAQNLTHDKTDLDENMKQYTHQMAALQNDFFGGQRPTTVVGSAAAAAGEMAASGEEAPGDEPLWMPSDELSSSAGGDDFPDDFQWASSTAEKELRGAGDFADLKAEDSTTYGKPTQREAKASDFPTGTLDFAAIPEEAVSQPTVSFAAVSAPLDDNDNEILGPDLVGETREPRAFGNFERKTSLLDRINPAHGRKKKKDKHGRHSAGEPGDFANNNEADWLGLGTDFDARSAGKEIGSWDNFEESSEDDEGFYWKGGAASGDMIEDPSFAADFAAKLKDRFSTDFSASNADEKELWFVATGAYSIHAAGMKAFLDLNGSDLKDALFINLETLGAGNLHWYAEEGLGSSHKASPRLVSLIRRAARIDNIKVKAAHDRSIATDATPALARGMRGMTVTRLERNGKPLHWRSVDDTIADISVENIDEAVQLIETMVREA